MHPDRRGPRRAPGRDRGASAATPCIGVRADGSLRFRDDPAIRGRASTRSSPPSRDAARFSSFDLRGAARELRLTISAPDGGEPVARELAARLRRGNPDVVWPRAHRRAGPLLLLLAFPARRMRRRYGDAEVGAAANAAGFGHIADRVAAVAQADRARRAQGAAARATRARHFPARRQSGPAVRARRWPRCGRRTQTFLGQFRLADLPPEASELGAHGGLLLVFTEVRFESRSATAPASGAGAARPSSTRPRALLLARTPATRGRSSCACGPPRFATRAPGRPGRRAWTSQSLAAPLERHPAGRQRGRSLVGPARVAAPAGRACSSHRLLGYVDTPNRGGSCWRRTRAAGRRLAPPDHDRARLRRSASRSRTAAGFRSRSPRPTWPPAASTASAASSTAPSRPVRPVTERK